MKAASEADMKLPAILPSREEFEFILGEVFYVQRTKLGLSQQEVADRSDGIVTKVKYGRIEKGAATMDAYELLTIMSVLDIAPVSLFEDFISYRPDRTFNDRLREAIEKQQQ